MFIGLKAMNPPRPVNYLQPREFAAAESMLMRTKIAARLIPESEFQDDKISEMYANYVDALISQYLRDNEVDKEIRFVVVESPVVNAIAASGPKFDLIAITLWTLFSLDAAAVKITSSSIFSDILSGKAKPLSNISAEKSRKDALAELFDGKGKGAITNTAFAISKIAQIFITYHELGHIINGHLRIGRVKNGSISEISNDSAEVSLTKDDKLTIRTLEFDADAFAVQHTLMAICKFPATNPGNPISLQVTGPLEAIQLTAAGISFAMMCLQAFSWRSSAVLTFADDTHPPTDLRVLNAMAQCTHIAESFIEKNDLPPGSFHKATLEGKAAVELSLCEITGVNFDIENMLNWARLSIEHNHASLKRWAELRPALMKVKYGKANLAPPQA